MTIDPDFLQKLICPVTRKPLRLLSAAEIDGWNEAIAAGLVSSRGGVAVEERLEAAVAPAEEEFCYRADGDIPILLADEALLRGRGGAPDPAGS